jgi:hypothetical protein
MFMPGVAVIHPHAKVFVAFNLGYHDVSPIVYICGGGVTARNRLAHTLRPP